MPLFFQNGILDRIFIFRCAVRIVHKGNEFKKKPLSPHTELLTQMLTGYIVILRIGVDAPCTFLPEQIVNEGVRRFIGIAFSLIGFTQHPAGAEGIRRAALLVIWRLRVGIDFADYLAGLF